MTERGQRLQKELDELGAYMSSSAYLGWVAARNAEVEGVKQRILMCPPINQENIATQLLSFGEWDCLEQILKSYEAARTALKARIDEEAEREIESASTTIQQ